MLWLSRRLGFAVMKDWYRLRMVHFLDNHGSGVLQIYWHSSPSEAVKETFPKYDWCEWLFTKVPNGFWDVRENRIRYMTWLGQQLHYHTFEDWLRLRHEDIEAYCGRRLLSLFDSIVDILCDVFPEQDWNAKRSLSLSEELILHWVDAYHGRHDEWPDLKSEPVQGMHETWVAIDLALRRGTRGLPGGSSLPKLLEQHRGRIRRNNQPILTEDQILSWADAYYEIHEKWPIQSSEKIEGTNENWRNISLCLRRGDRGLPGGSSLAQLLEEYRGYRHWNNAPSLSEERILTWADEYFRIHNKWPTEISGMIFDTDENWKNISQCLRIGLRGLPGGSSLAQLLQSHRDYQNPKGKPSLTEDQILAWADLHYQRHGRWPVIVSGQIEGEDLTWSAVNLALQRGTRGLPGGSSLARLLETYRGKRNNYNRPPLTEEKILAWADAYYVQHNRWPTRTSGTIAETEDTWCAVHTALQRGSRGLPGGSSLAKLLDAHRRRPK